MGAPHSTTWRGGVPLLGRGTGNVSPSVTLHPCRRVNLALAYTELTEELCRLRNLSSLQSQILRALLQEKSLNGGKRGGPGLKPMAGWGWDAKNGETTLAALILRLVLSSCMCPSRGSSILEGIHPREYPSRGVSIPGSIRPGEHPSRGVSIPGSIHPREHPSPGASLLPGFPTAAFPHPSGMHVGDEGYLPCR